MTTGAHGLTWHGRAAFPALLLALTVVTGVVDAVSYLRLGHTFVANMTGNVVFLGFGLAGAADVSASASVVALVAFLAGALAGGRLGRRLGGHRGRHLTIAALIGLAGLVAALVISLVWGDQPAAARYVLLFVLAAAMGLQNATARALAVPDMTTTVVTLTLTGLAADSPWGARKPSKPLRRVASVGAMFAGALAGALLVLHVGVAAALGLGTLLQIAIAVTAHLLSRGTEPAAWAPAGASSA
ncbi:YoaK family protein [Amycolatopsis sp. FDAARGOS 1241]|uniref:YoaK family protein n=1 Tax=Amycolatopsis sp. FDAARGOS 1241 TaxID=2778070 RepID=UPI00194E16C9|nr:YoaK family protein [Amycolatopsis sp. FDAARGOS 1241]QRP47951.1 DUF1275 domain-containing protein [Amycolatopsis sp. FDAARGOS 1241]